MGDLGSGDGSSYPTALDTHVNLEVDSPSASKTKARADVPNDLASAILAIETELGTTPSSACADVATFLQVEHTTSGTHKAITTTTLNATGQITSTLAVGTKPFVITSTTKSDNLNADLIDGYHASQTPTSNEVVVTNGSGEITLRNNKIFNFLDTTDSVRGCLRWDNADIVYWGDLEQGYTGYCYLSGASESSLKFVPYGGAARTVWHSGNVANAPASDEADLKIIRGQVDADGTILLGSGFTITKGLTGIYTINFTSSFSAVPTVVAMTKDHTPPTYCAGPYSGFGSVNSFDIHTYDNGVLTNFPFNFIAIGPK